MVTARDAATHGTRAARSSADVGPWHRKVGAALSPLECLHIIALFRFLLPKTEIKIAGGRAQSLRDLQSWVFRAGATSLMVGNYLTTTGREAHLDRQMVEDLGMKVVREFSRR